MGEFLEVIIVLLIPCLCRSLIERITSLGITCILITCDLSRPERSIHRIDGEFELVFGTSASSPVVGSLITLVNDARIAAGKGPVGKYRNPMLIGRRNKLIH